MEDARCHQLEVKVSRHSLHTFKEDRERRRIEDTMA